MAGHGDDEDYISLLPDCLIHHIFSFLATRDVVKTCVLSKRWRSVWTTVSDLRFSFSCYDGHLFVDRVLTLYAWGKVEKFHLDIRSEHFHTSKIDSWVRFAIDHQVEELRLNSDIRPAYKLSPLLYNFSSLTKLCLSGCALSSSESISWSSLKSLSLQNVKVSDDVLMKILMGSPVLEHLNLTECWGVRGLQSTSLKEFGIDGTVAESPLHISTPRLLSLRVRTHYVHEMIRIVEAPSLLEAELDFANPTKSDVRLLREMLCKLQNATRILLGSWWAWVTRPLKVEDVQVSLPRCKSLTLHLPTPDSDFPAIAGMLATTPNLEKLFIVFKPWDLLESASDSDCEEIFNESYCRLKMKLKRWA